jgi:TonB family protein
MNNVDSNVTKSSLSIASQGLESDNAANNKMALKVFGVVIGLVATIIVILLVIPESKEASMPASNDLSFDAAKNNKNIETNPEITREDPVQAINEDMEKEISVPSGVPSSNELLNESENPVIASNEMLQPDVEEGFESSFKNDLVDAFVRIGSLESELDRAITENSSLENNLKVLTEQVNKLNARQGELILDYETQIDKKDELIESLNRELELQASRYADLELALTPVVEDYKPLVAIAPDYPTRAAQRGVEGWCLVSFTVDSLGNVIEETITVVDAEPVDIFNRSSMRAAARFKFQPRLVDGKGVEVANVEYLFRYELGD